MIPRLSDKTVTMLRDAAMVCRTSVCPKDGVQSMALGVVALPCQRYEATPDVGQLLAALCDEVMDGRKTAELAKGAVGEMSPEAMALALADLHGKVLDLGKKLAARDQEAVGLRAERAQARQDIAELRVLACRACNGTGRVVVASGGRAFADYCPVCSPRES